MPKKNVKEPQRAPFWRGIWPKRQSGRGRDQPQSRWRRFWRNWGAFLLIVLAIVGIAIFIYSRGQPPVLSKVVPYRLYFTQGNLGSPAPLGLESAILDDIAAAGESVDVATPGLDLEKLAEGLIAAQRRGVEVRVLEDGSTQDVPAVVTVMNRLRAAGMPVVLRQAPGALAESFVVVDQKVVWAGSWELSREGLDQDSGCVLRWELAQMAQDFHSEFMEMFGEKAFGATSPKNTSYTHLAVLDTSSISMYMTPEDDALAQILQSIFPPNKPAIRFLILLGQGVDAPPFALGELLLNQLRRTDLLFLGVLDRAGMNEPFAEALKKEKPLDTYGGTGRLRENVLIVGQEIVILFSGRMGQETLDPRAGLDDGYVIIVNDPELVKVFIEEAERLPVAPQPTLPPTAAEPVPTLPTPTSPSLVQP